MSIVESWRCSDNSCVCRLPPNWKRAPFDYQIPDYSKIFKEPYMPTVNIAPSMTEMVREFHNHFGVREDHKMDSISLVNLRYDLIAEEVAELEEALYDGKVPDKAEAADALGDIIYVAIGAALAWGIDIERVLAEIHRSNMTKSLTDRGTGGKVPIGKIMKGADYSPPDLSFVMEGK